MFFEERSEQALPAKRKIPHIRTSAKPQYTDGRKNTAEKTRQNFDKISRLGVIITTHPDGSSSCEKG
jgi:hypothetical protein